MHRFVTLALASALLLVMPAAGFAQNRSRSEDPTVNRGEGLTASKSRVESRRSNKVKKEDQAEFVPVYMFATSFSLMDTVIYVSSIQKMENEKISAKCFLENRTAYSAQFSNYMESCGAEMQTSALFFNTKWKKILRQYSKVRKKAIDKHGFTITDMGEFKFEKVEEPVEAELAIPDMTN